MMKTKYLLPKKIIKACNAENTNSLLSRKPLQIDLAENDLMIVHKGAFIILDFKTEMRGGIRILTHSTTEPIKVRIRFGESLSEVNANIGEFNSTTDHSPRDFEYILPMFSDVEIGDTGFRFVRIDFYNENDFGIKNIYAASKYKNHKILYKYSGNDREIAKIYKAAKLTIDLCSVGDYIWDGVKRDRLVWAGDLCPEVLALTTLYGRNVETEYSLNFVMNQTPLPKFMDGFCTYSMWWIYTLNEYYKLTNCHDFIVDKIDYISGLVDAFIPLVKDNGELDLPFYFVDWPTHEQVDEKAGCRAIFIIAIKAAKELLTLFNRNSKKCDELLDKLNKIKIVSQEKKQVVALKYFATGELTDDEFTFLVDGGAKGLSTFMSYFVLTAIASKDKEKAISIMKEYYGAMLNLGATTFFEDFDIDWANNSAKLDKISKTKNNIHSDFGAYCYKGLRHSLCHGWSSGVIKFIKENC